MYLFESPKKKEIKCYGKVRITYINSFPKTTFFDHSHSSGERLNKRAEKDSDENKKNIFSSKKGNGSLSQSGSDMSPSSIDVSKESHAKSFRAKKKILHSENLKKSRVRQPKFVKKKDVVVSPKIVPDWDSIDKHDLCIEKAPMKNSPSLNMKHRRNQMNPVLNNSAQSNLISRFSELNDKLDSPEIVDLTSNVMDLRISETKDTSDTESIDKLVLKHSVIQTSTPLTSKVDKRKMNFLNISKISMFGKKTKKKVKQNVTHKSVKKRKKKKDVPLSSKMPAYVINSSKEIKSCDVLIASLKKESQLMPPLQTFANKNNAINYESPEVKENMKNKIASQNNRSTFDSDFAYKPLSQKNDSIIDPVVIENSEHSREIATIQQTCFRTSGSLTPAKVTLPLTNSTHSDLRLQSSVSHKQYTKSEELETSGPSVLTKLLQESNQKDILSFSNLYDWSITTVRKIGEGTFGEVFTITLNKKSAVIKVIPMSAMGENSDFQTFDSVLSEVKVTKCLGSLRNNKKYNTQNYINMKSAHVVKGSYPEKLSKAWDDFDNIQTSYNNNPDTFSENQIYAILELEYGGKDLTNFEIRNAVEAEVIFKQIAISLAIAEDSHIYEHRDLHMGNILVQRSKRKFISYIFRGKSIKIPCFGIFVTIIDFTLSRVMDDGCIYYNDIANDESLFNQTGDYQFVVYRVTKLHLKNEWNECLLYSNVLWLIYLCKKFQEHAYTRPSSISHKKSLENISSFEKKIESCTSALECLIECDIISHVSTRNQAQDSVLANTIYIDRNSFHKSSSCIKD